VTDVLGRPASPEGRRLIRDRRTPAEKAASRARTIQEADTKIGKRKEEEARVFEEKRALARERAGVEWEEEEAARQLAMETEMAGRLMGEVSLLQEQTERVRAQVEQRGQRVDYQ